MIAHGISTGALFILVGQLYERIHTRDINKMGGLWEKAPVMGAAGLIFSMASLGLPGLGNFIAELLILIGAFKANILMSCLASLGLIAATIYSLRIVQKVFLGKENTDWKINDLTLREKAVSASLIIAIVWLGLFPKPVLDTAKPAVLKTLIKQKEIILQNPGSNFEKIHCGPSYNHLCVLVVSKKSFNNKGCSPHPPQGVANTLPFSIFRPETDNNLPIISGPILGLQLKLPEEQKINPPLGGMRGGNSVLMDLIKF
jgi:NADH:ubiquinone oxidoreductase subunit 5 (subunit L)/multisubunit Na+/H+ antiporter MnhA subunit